MIVSSIIKIAKAEKRWQAAVFIFILSNVLWVILSYVFNINTIFLPTPVQTYRTFFISLGQKLFWQDIMASWARVTLAFLLSIAIAYPLILISLANRRLRDSIFILVEFFRYLPIPVFVPITILWFGISDIGKIVIVFLGTFTQMIPMFYDSCLLVKGKFDATEKALKWKRGKTIRYIIMPGSAPHMYDNARICLGWAWTYLVVAELLGAKYGIGYAIIRAQRYLATDKIFTYVLVIGIMGLLTDFVLKKMKMRIFRWE